MRLLRFCNSCKLFEAQVAGAFLTGVFLFLSFSAWFAQEGASPQLRRQAIASTAEILFASESKIYRQQRDNFEQDHGIKLNFTVDDASIDKLGGLSEHLFRLYKTIATPSLDHRKTINGEFSLLDNGVLTDLLSYRTHVTSDLADCALPLEGARTIDSTCTEVLHDKRIGVSHQPGDLINQTLGLATNEYHQVLCRNRHCSALSNADYDLFVLNTASVRASRWSNDTKVISDALFRNYNSLSQAFTASGNAGSTGVNLNLPQNSQRNHVIELGNGLIHSCQRLDMENSCKLLFKETGIRYLFITKFLDYFIPRDSLDVFLSEATSSFTENVADELILAVYVNLHDVGSGKSSSVLLVRQLNGTWLNAGDIAYANYNSQGVFRKTVKSKFYNLYKNIPKPLVMCYQVAKVNGLFTTMYLRRQQVKGQPAIYAHVFRYDKGFSKIAGYDAEVKVWRDIAYAPGKNGIQTGYDNPQVRAELEKYTLLLKSAYLHAVYEPELETADFQVKEVYVSDSVLVKAAVLRRMQQMFGALYVNNKFSGLYNEVTVPSDVFAGTCPSEEEEDVVGTLLDWTSLVLSPTGLDFIPDALSVVYYAATGNITKSLMAAGSLALVGVLGPLVKSAGDAMKATNRGSHLIRQGNDLLELAADPHVLSTAYGIGTVSPQLANKIVDNPEVTALLIGKKSGKGLQPDAELQKVFKNIEALPPQKRHELVEKCYDDASFRNKLLSDGDEVLRWGGVLLSRQKTRLFKLNESFGPLDYEQFKTISDKTLDQLDKSMFEEMFELLGNRPNWTIEQKKAKLLELIASSDVIPSKVNMSVGDNLYKVVKKNSVPSQYTEYWMTKDELEILTSNGSNFENKAGFPLGSYAEEYDIFEITALDQNIVYQSRIAPTEQRGYYSSGGGMQTLVLDRTKWSLPIKINTESYIPNF